MDKSLGNTESDAHTLTLWNMGADMKLVNGIYTVAMVIIN